MKKNFLTLLMALAALTGMAQNNYTHYQVRQTHHPADVRHYDTERLRQEFLIDTIFAQGQIHLVYSQYDRFLIGGVQPGTTPLRLQPIEPLGVEHFLAQREMGIINVGGKGTVIIDGKDYDLDFKEALYVGRGDYEISFRSEDAANPARFYLNSATAHKAYPIKKVTLKEAKKIKAGSLAESNDRVINQLIIDGVAGVRTCQLQMGLTELQTGSVWNTMPAHTHLRRMETYLYFNVPQNQMVCHFMGEPQETRPVWMGDCQAVISPQWSIHCAAGTSNYSFIWGMAGENLDYGDMQPVKITDMK